MSPHTATINVLRTLCLLGRKGGRLGVSDVMDDLGVSRATAYRYLSYLESFGLASRFGRGTFILGPEISSLDKASRLGDPLVVAAAPVLSSLSKNTGATVLLEKMVGQRRVIVLMQTGRLGPERFIELEGTTGRPCGDETDVRSVDQATALRISVSGNKGGVTATEDADGDVEEPVCMVDGERMDVTAFAGQVLLRGRFVCRVVAVVQLGMVNPPDSSIVREQVRRAALRIEGRLEAVL